MVSLRIISASFAADSRLRGGGDEPGVGFRLRLCLDKAPTDVEPPQSDPARARTPRSGSRARHINLTVWLAADFKSNLRLVQARQGPGATFQDLLAEALNDLFIKYDVPTVHPD